MWVLAISERYIEQTQKQCVLGFPWPLLGLHFLSCLLTGCDQSDYWNNKYHCWHKMDVVCHSGWRKTVAYLSFSFWGLAWDLRWLIAGFLWEAGSMGTQEVLFPSNLGWELMAFPRVTGGNLAPQGTTPLLGLGGGEGQSAGWGGAEPESAVHSCNLCACASHQSNTDVWT